jgi:hypothetical protein
MYGTLEVPIKVTAQLLTGRESDSGACLKNSSTGTRSISSSFDLQV